MTLDTRWKNPQGSDPNQLYLWAQDLIKELRRGGYLEGLEGSIDDLLDTKADKDQVVAASFVFKAPENETVRLIIKCPFAWTITETVTRTEVGTATCTFSIDGVNLGGTANSASTSEQAQSHSSANVVDANDDVEVAFSSTSADCENLAITIAGTRVLA